MAISQAMCTSFKKELLQGVHNFTLMRLVVLGMTLVERL